MQINNTEKKSFLAFVSGENSFSFFDRVEFLFFYFYIAGSIVILSYFLWNLLFNKTLAYGGFFLVVLLILVVRREKKFTMPYWDYLGRDRLAGLKRAQLINEFDSAAGRFSDQKSGNIVTAVLGVILILFGTYLGFFTIPGLALSGEIFRWGVVIGIAVMIVLYFKTSRIWKAIESNQINEKQGLRMVQLMLCFSCFILSIWFSAIVSYRFKEITGSDIFRGNISDLRRSDNVTKSIF